MNIYIDESGVFKTADHTNAWCVVVAYMETEKNFKNLKKLLLELKLDCGKTYKDEVKLNNLTEHRYIEFLKRLNKFDGSLYATATDMSLISDSDIILHRDIQAADIVKHKKKMIHESGKKALQDLSDQIVRLSPQLYMQIVCQINLMADVINRGVLYYVKETLKI